MPDYTQQLNEIVHALNKEAPPWFINPWLLASFSTVLGTVFGFFGQMLNVWYNDLKKQHTMRKMIYRDATGLLSQLYIVVNATRGETDPVYSAIRRHTILMNWSSLSEKYLTANPDIYMRIDERPSNDAIHGAIRSLEENTVPGAIDPLISIAFKIVLIQFKTGRLTTYYLRKYLNKDEYKTLNEMLGKYPDDVSQLWI
jgi:hypothetical protein